MKKGKQILAILGILCLVGLYVTTLILAITDASAKMSFFRASVFATVIIPSLIWIYSYVYRIIQKYFGKESDTPTGEDTSPDKSEE